MIDLSGARSGELGKETMFSDLFAAASLSQFTGGFLIRAPKDAAVFFRGGTPVHAGGIGFEKHFVGEMLMRAAACTQTQLVNALEKQNGAEGTRPLIGQLLIDDAGVDPNKVKEALSAQIEARVLGLFAITEGSWQSAPGENARIREIGVPCTTKGILIKGLLENASDDELRAASDVLLGKAVQLSGALPPLELAPNEQKILRYLEKPRKPDQLERAVNNRRAVRAVLRLLLLLGKAKLFPAGQAIPIPKATILKPNLPGLYPEEPQQAPAKEEARGRASPMPAPPPPPRADVELIAEVRSLHADLGRKTYFELLGATPETPPDVVKKNYHTLAKKFHPDAFGSAQSEEITQMARELSAKFNEANQALTNEKSRAEYIALLNDERIKGDSRKAEKIRDAEVKHQMGIVMVKKKDYQKAREYFNYAVQSDPDAGDYKASLAWAMFADPKFDRDEALSKGYALILEALKVKVPSATTHFYAGQILKAKSKNDEALFHFKRATEIDPRHAEATREVRLLEMRKQKENDDTGSNPLRKLFKR